MTKTEWTDQQYDIADAATEWLERHPGYHTPSTIGRGIRQDTVLTRNVLQLMAAEQLVDAAGIGSLTRYTAH